MLNFKDFKQTIVNEAVKAVDTQKVAKLITTYLHKKLGQATLYPAIEQFKRGSDTYTSVTVLLGYPKYVRFNWLHGKLDQNSLHSVTIADGNDRKEITFDKEISLAQSLPQIVKVLQHKVTAPSFEFYLEESVEGEVLTEAKGDDPLEAVKAHIANLRIGDRLVVSKLNLTALEYKMIRQLVSDNPSCFDGYKLLSRNLDYRSTKELMHDSKVKMTVKKDSTKETWVKPDAIDEKDVEEQISYIEKVNDLSSMIKFMLKGATNAVFCAGRGGCLRGDTKINIEI